MRIAIANPTGGGLSGGYQKYLNRLVPELARHPSVASLGVFVPPSLTGRLDPAVPIDPVESGSWTAAIERFGADVVFIPTARVVRVGALPVVTMMRNMEPVTVPFAGNTVGESLRNVGRAITAFRACHSADRVIAVSEYVATFLRRRWRVSAEQIGVVPHGVDPPRDATLWRRPQRLVDPDALFLFTAGSIRPARGLVTAIDAFAQLSPHHAQLRLVIAGQPTPDAEAHFAYLRARAAAAGVGHRVDWVGSLVGDEMAWCYGHAVAFVMTSRAEACPNVALEALSHGCLVVSTHRDPMPEFFGDAAVYTARDDDAGALGDALKRVVAAPDQFAGLRQAAVERAARYTWAETARRTISELVRAVELTSARRVA